MRSYSVNLIGFNNFKIAKDLICFLKETDNFFFIQISDQHRHKNRCNCKSGAKMLWSTAAANNYFSIDYSINYSVDNQIKNIVRFCCKHSYFMTNTII